MPFSKNDMIVINYFEMKLEKNLDSNKKGDKGTEQLSAINELLWWTVRDEISDIEKTKQRNNLQENNPNTYIFGSLRDRTLIKMH